MKQNLFKFFLGALAFTAVIAIWSSCTRSTPFGSDLLEEDEADFFADTLSITATVIPEDSVQTSSTSESSFPMLIGEVVDPVFGKTTSEIFTLVRLQNALTGFTNTTIVVDSVVMYLSYSASNITGDTLTPLNFRVHRLSEQLRWDSVYYADDELEIADQIGTLDNFLARPSAKDSISPSADGVSFIKIPLEKSFGDTLMSFDSATLHSDTLLWRRLRGLRLSITPNGQPGALLAFDLNNSLVSFIRVYSRLVSPDTTRARQVFFEFDGGNKFTHYEHDYSGSKAQDAINQVNPSLLFVQSTEGLRLRIELPDTSVLPNNAIINQALLEFTVAPTPDLPNVFPPATQVYLTERQGDTTYVPIPDVTFSTLAFSDFREFGGTPDSITVNGMPLVRYYMNISEMLQTVLTDPKRRTIYLNVFPQATKLAQSVLYGPQDPDYPARLTIKYTRITPF